MLRTPWGNAEALRSRQLAPGRSGDRESVRRDQRERLYAAMVASCDEKGFEATTVEDLLRISGVSRATFYENFADKADCFSSAERELVDDALRAIARRLEGSGGGEARARAAFEAFVDLLVAQPAAARMCLLESHAAGRAGIAPVRGGIDQAVQLGREALEQIPGRQGMPDAVTRGIVSGFFQVIFTRLRNQSEEELPGFVDPLWHWAMSYEPPPRPLRRTGRRGIVPQESTMPPFAAYSPEQRIIRAFSRVVAEKGYGATTIADIAAAASISQTTFYLHFAGKDDALAAALDSSGAQMEAAVMPATRRAPDWATAVRVGFEAICGFLAAEPDFARLRLVEVDAAGPAALAMRDRTGIEFLGTVLAPAFEELPQVPPIVVEAIAGADYGLLCAHAREGRVAELPELAPVPTYLTLAPFLGAERACEVATGSVAPAGRRRTAGGAGEVR